MSWGMAERSPQSTRLSFDKNRGTLPDMRLPPRDPHIPDLVSATEAAEILHLTRQAVQLMATNGKLRGAKVGATWVFRRTVVDKAAAERTSAEPAAG